MKHFFMVLVAILLSVSLAAQSISGRVVDAETKEPLQGATILAGSTRAITSNTGSFSLPRGTTEMEVSFTGYSARKIQVRSSLLVILLQRNTNSLGEVILSASRTAQQRSEAPLAIATISKQTMNDTKATQLDQLLNKVSGVNMVDLGNEQHEMSIRQPMTTKSLFLYLEDGIPIRTTGLYNHNALLEMNLPAAGQIEIIKGPASSIYGAEAIGGAVNIITQAPPAYLNGMASLQFNNAGYKRGEWQAGNTFGKLGVVISGYYADRRHGPIDHSDFHKTAITLRADYAIDQKTKWVNDLSYIDYYSDMLGTLDSAHFANKDYSTPQTFTYRKVPALRFKSQLFHDWNDHSSSRLSLVYRENSVQQNPSYRVKDAANDPSLAYGEINESTFNTFMLVAQHQQSVRFLNSKLIMGASFDGSPSQYNSHFIRIQRDARGYYTSYAATDSVLSHYWTRIHNLASYMQAEATPVRGLKLTAALRYDYYHYNFINDLPPSAFTGAPSSRQNFQRVSPKVGATFNYKGIGLYVNYSEGFVPPQVSELFSGVRVPYLNSQTFFNYEIGGWLSLVKNKLYADWSLYLLNGSNEIISVKNQDGSTENQNAGKTQHRGIEYGLNYRPSSRLHFRFSGATSRHSFIEYVEKGTDYGGKELPGGPHLIANAEATWKPAFIKGLRLSLEWQHIGPYYMDNANTRRYEGYDVFNARAGYTIKGFEIWMNAMNVTNTYYSTYASKAGNTISYNPGKPRELNMGVAYHFSKKRKTIK